MSKLLNWFKRKKTPEDGAGDNGNDLIIQVGSGGFVVREHEGKGELVTQGVALKHEGNPVDQIEQIIQAAVQQIPTRKLKSASRLSVILDSDDTQFVDMRQSSLGTANNERIREFGNHLTGSKYVSFGRMTFGQSSKGKKTQQGLIGFIDHNALERYLAALGEHCTKLEFLVPSGSLLISRAEGFDKKTYAGLLVGGDHSTLVVARPEQHTAVVRYIPVGRDSLVDAVAEKVSLGREQVLENFGKSDYFRALIENEQSGQHNVSIGPIEDAMKPSLERLAEEISSTAGYFEQHLAADRPDQIELLGDSDQLKGFRNWLGAALGLEVQRIDTPLTESFRHGDLDRHMNLLSGLEGNPIQVGKARYTMQDRKLIKATQPRKSNLAQNKANAGRSRSSSGAANRRRATQKDKESWVGRLFKKSEVTAPDPNEEVKNEAVFFIGFFLILFGVFFWGYKQFDKVNDTLIGQALQYAKAMDQTKAWKQKLSTLGVEPVVAVPSDSQKILWTEKFLALSEQMTNELWLTDVHVEDSSTVFGELELATKRLTIEGAALPSSEGHIAEIADFIKRLENDDERFMTDFQLITFEGSSVDADDRDPVVRFSLSAWYDQAKRLKIMKARKENKKPLSPLEQTQKNVADKRKAEERALRGLTGGGN